MCLVKAYLQRRAPIGSYAYTLSIIHLAGGTYSSVHVWFHLISGPEAFGPRGLARERPRAAKGTYPMICCIIT